MATPRTPESGVSHVDTRLVLGSQLERPAVLSELTVERSIQEALLDHQVSLTLKAGREVTRKKRNETFAVIAKKLDEDSWMFD